MDSSKYQSIFGTKPAAKMKSQSTNPNELINGLSRRRSKFWNEYSQSPDLNLMEWEKIPHCGMLCTGNPPHPTNDPKRSGRKGEIIRIKQNKLLRSNLLSAILQAKGAIKY